MAKPRAIEGLGDIYVIRPLGFLFVQLFRRTPVTPTMVSFLAVLAGWWTAWLYYRSNAAGGIPSLGAAAVLTFLLHSALDSADGQLARVTGRTSELGRIVDGFCDSLAFLSIYVAIAVSTAQRLGEHQAALAAMALVATFTHSLQSSLTEFVRTLYLYAVHGKRDIVESDPRNIAAAARRQGGFFAALLHTLHLQYYRQQRAVLASTARLEALVVETLERHPRRRGELARVYEGVQRPALKGWTLLAPNAHKVGMALAAFLPVAEGSFWGGLGMGWYLVYDLLLNAVMGVLILRQRSVDGKTMRAVRGLGHVRPAAGAAS